MNERRLGANGPEVRRSDWAAWACPPSTGRPIGPRASPRSTRRSMRASTLLDTGDFYGMGHNELLIATRSRPRRARTICSASSSARCAIPRRAGRASTPARGGEEFPRLFAAPPRHRYIDMYRPARLDPAVPIEETVGAIADMVKAGYVRQIGLSEVGAVDDPPRARSIRSPICRSSTRSSRAGSRPRSCRLPRARHGDHRLRRAVARPDQRPLVEGTRAGAGDFRAHGPRFQGENRDHNLALVEALRTHRRAGRDCRPLAIAWVLARGKDIVAADRRAHARPTRGSSRCAPVDARRRGSRRARARGPAGRRRGGRYPAAEMAHSTASVASHSEVRCPGHRGCRERGPAAPRVQP